MRQIETSFKEFYEKALHEAKCNNCGECCKEKIIKEGKVYVTDNYCPAYDISNKRCSIYATRLTEAKQRFNVNCCTVEESIASGQHPKNCPYVTNDYECICEHISTLS